MQGTRFVHRRTVLKMAAGAIQAAAAMLLGVPGFRFLWGGSGRRRGESEFVRAVPFADLADGKPVRVVIAADRWDAYVHYPPGPIGSVWLIRENGARESGRVRCLQTICPHLGCGIDFAASRGLFTCPCHASAFDVSGRVLGGPSARAMDELECRIGEPDEQGRRWVEVRYQEFQTGVADRRVIA
jgi:Rieske Fe-S protein